MTYEQIVMQIIVNGGDARASAIKAVRSARNENIEEAEQLMSRAQESIVKAHEIQTSLLHKEARGEKTEMTMLMVHAQDHLMNAITVKELAEELIEECKLRSALQKKVEGVLDK